VLSVIVSMFNERSTIATALARVRRAETLGLRKELLVVGDGSTDGTREWLQHAQGDGLKAVSHLFNRGRATHRLRDGHGRCWCRIPIWSTLPRTTRGCCVRLLTEGERWCSACAS